MKRLFWMGGAPQTLTKIDRRAAAADTMKTAQSFNCKTCTTDRYVAYLHRRQNDWHQKPMMMMRGAILSPPSERTVKGFTKTIIIIDACSDDLHRPNSAP